MSIYTPCQRLIRDQRKKQGLEDLVHGLVGQFDAETVVERAGG